MDLVVGTNTYVSLADADEFIRAFNTPTEPIYVWWDSLSTEERTVYLLRSAKYIERLPFTGFTTTTTQAMAFPRNGAVEVPDAVIEAQILNAYFAATDTSTDADYNPNLQSFSLGNLSESYFGPDNSRQFKCSREVLFLLGNWLNGGFGIV